MIEVGKIFYRRRGIFCLESVHDNQLDFHSFREHTFNIHPCVTACRYARRILGKSCQIGRQLDENSVAFNGTDNSRNGFAGCKFIGVLLPCAEQLLVGKGYSALLVNRLDDNPYRLTDGKTDGRVRYS